MALLVLILAAIAIVVVPALVSGWFVDSVWSRIGGRRARERSRAQAGAIAEGFRNEDEHGP